MVLVLVGNGWSETAIDLTGNQWHKWDTKEKAFYISGFISGSDYTIIGNVVSLPDDWYLEENQNIAIGLLGEYYIIKQVGDMLEDKELKKKGINKNRGFNTKEVSILLDARDSVRNSGLRRYHVGAVGVRQIVDGVEKLFEDFKNRNIPITDAVYVVSRQIKGTSPEKIEKILLYLRSGKKEVKHLEVRDENSKFPSFIEFP